jgi:hypothetical protein
VHQQARNGIYPRNLSLVSTDSTHESDNLTTQKSNSSLGNSGKIESQRLSSEGS